MKILVDTCVWGGVKTALLAEGYDALWTGGNQPDPGDEAILAQAFEENRIVITLDKDFGELAVVKGFPHCGIIRLVGLSTAEQVRVSLAVLKAHGDELQQGALITADRTRIRIRPADRKP